MQERRVDERQGQSARSPDQTDKVVEGLARHEGHVGRAQHHAHAEEVLHPLLRCGSALADVQHVLQDPERRKELERVREEHRDGVCHLHEPPKGVVGEVERHERIHMLAVGGVAQQREEGVEARERHHYANHDAPEVLLVGHGLLDRDNQSNALERDHHRAEEQQHSRGLERLHRLGAVGGDVRHVVADGQPERAQQARVGDEHGEPEVAHVPDPAHWHVQEHLDADERVLVHDELAPRKVYHPAQPVLEVA
mmetsp:Transcript_6117/g.20601  ORF Transcript_6117/g.20601 Transcript_6117/m.20601 type:complete len:252 (+) Transcript_6117:236-991(+)